MPNKMQSEVISITLPKTWKKHNQLTLREISALTNRIAATTRYFSRLLVRYKTLAITLLRRKLHLPDEKEG